MAAPQAPGPFTSITPIDRRAFPRFPPNYPPQASERDSILIADRTLFREPQRAANSSATGLANSVKSFVLVPMIIIFTKKFSLASLV